MTNASDLNRVDLEPAAARLAELVAGVPGELLQAPTPCPAYVVGDLVDHVGGLAIAFTDAAKKTPPGGRLARGIGRRVSPGPWLANPHPRRPGIPGRSMARPGGVERDHRCRWARAARRGGRTGGLERARGPRLGPGPGHRTDVSQRPGIAATRPRTPSSARSPRGPVSSARARSGRWSRCPMMHPWSHASSGSAAVTPIGRPDALTR